MRRALYVLTAACILGGCNQFNKLVNGEPRRSDRYDTTPVPVVIDGVTSFDYDTVYNVAAVGLVTVKRPGDASYWTLNIYEYQYDTAARALHFGKLVAVSGDRLTVENEPAAPIGTLYRIVSQ